nr:MAG TPA: structural protein [Caudoviricetes sp.]
MSRIRRSVMVASFQRPIHRVWCIGLRSILIGVLHLEV